MDDIERTKRRIRNPLPLKGYERKIYLANTLLLISGVTLSVSLKDWQYFERSGSLVVIVGIGVTWRDFAGKIEWFKSVASKAIDQEIFKIETRKSPGLINYSPENEARIESVKNKLRNHKTGIDELFAALRQRLRSIEAMTLILGTFIWGYGSVIGNAIYKFNV